MDASSGEQAKKKGLWRKEIYLGILGIVFMLLIAMAVVYFWETVRTLGAYGYLGAFVISLLGSATIIVPIPALPVIFALGGVLEPVFVGIAVGLAEPIGELTGYMAGRGGRIALQNNKGLYSRMEDWMRRRGSITLFVAASLPNPIFDMVGMAAGAVRFPLRRFLLVCWAGKTVKGMIIAFAGAWGLRPIMQLLGMFG